MIYSEIRDAVNRHPGKILRQDVDRAKSRLSELGVSEDSSFGQFFAEFQGPFPFGRGDRELLDIDRPTPAISRATKFVQDLYGLPPHFICITSPEGEGFVLYDKRTDSVFDTGLEELPALLSGNLRPRWRTFFDYLRDYFSEIRKPA